MANPQRFEALGKTVDENADILFIGALHPRKVSVDRVLRQHGVHAETLRSLVAATQKLYPDSPHLLDEKRDAVSDLLGGDVNTAEDFLLLESVRANAHALAELLQARRTMRGDMVARALPDVVRTICDRVQQQTTYLSGYVQALSGSGEHVTGIAMRSFVEAVERSMDKQSPAR
ncbi:MAG: hypothetical protein DI582_06005 [Azospirillum brasilense]|nr:MAG: hypothetical protein DI582_06005 [Azospirillum brasilense]